MIVTWGQEGGTSEVVGHVLFLDRTAYHTGVLT